MWTHLRTLATPLLLSVLLGQGCGAGEPMRPDDAGTSADLTATCDPCDTQDLRASADLSLADLTSPANTDLSSSPGSYTTQFLGTENPISESGRWTSGAATGLDWLNIAKDSGLGYAASTSAGYNDAIAHLNGFPANQYAQATVHFQSGYSPQNNHEIELLLRFQIAAHSARGYEINCAWNGAYSQIVRWNGALNDFTYLNPTGPGFGMLVNGDVIKASAVGSTITVYKNGAQVMQVTDAVWSDGNPGMAMFVRPDASTVPKSFCFSAYSAGSL